MNRLIAPTLAIALGLSGFGFQAAASASDEVVEARPGSVVRWPGGGVSACGRGDRSWSPIAGDCWFAIDLLEPAGTLVVHRLRSGRREQARIDVSEYPYPVQRITIEDTSRVDLSPENLSRVRRDQAAVRPLWKLDGPPRFSLPLGSPLESLGTPGSFGSRRFFNDQPRSPHSGADYPATEGTPVLSVAPGKVVLAADLFFSGNSVFVDHGDGMISMYFHLAEMAVEEGAEVEQGAVLGKVGSTGRTTGPHLHFGVRWKGAKVDPAQLLGPVADIPELR